MIFISNNQNQDISIKKIELNNISLTDTSKQQVEDVRKNEITVVKYWKKYPMQCVFSMNGKCMLRGSWELVL